MTHSRAQSGRWIEAEHATTDGARQDDGSRIAAVRTKKYRRLELVPVEIGLQRERDRGRRWIGVRTRDQRGDDDHRARDPNQRAVDAT